MKITKEDIKTYFEYGPMEFEFKKAMILYWIVDFPISSIIFWLIYFLRR